MIRAIFVAGLFLILLAGILAMYRAWKIRIREEKEMRQREMEHEERQELFEDENL